MLSAYTAVIQAGGMGTRLKKLTGDKIPKPMVELNGKPMLCWQLDALIQNGIKKFVFIIGYLSEKIKEYFGDGSKWNVEIKYIEEKWPLGSAGALYYLREYNISETFLLVFGDIMFDIDVERMIQFHNNKNAIITLLVHPNSHPYDSDLIVMDKEECIIGIDYKENERNYWYKNCVNAGIYIFSTEILLLVDKLEKKDIERDLIAPNISTGKIYGYKTTEYVKDAGTVERFYQVGKAQMQGIWKSKNLINKQKCIFLDRDGTLNKFNGLIYEEDTFELEECAAEAIRLINHSGYLVIVITNQPVVARGMCSINDIEKIHNKMEVLLGREGAYLDDILYCPHHPDKGYPNENIKYKIICNCRKPATEMIDKMVFKYNIDRKKSYMIGDSTVDIKTGINAGLKSVLVNTGQAGKDGKFNVNADFEAENLLEAVKLILGI